MSEAASSPSFPIVALGASAGGLEAFQRFFDHVPDDIGMGFVVVSHLDPNHDSHLVDLLSRHTRMRVVKAADGNRVEPDHVYLIPPNADLSIHRGVLHVTPPREPRGFRAPIDLFFTSLAEDAGSRAVCIVLSGTGSDGALGLRAVKEHGGLTMAQSHETARYDGMPRSAMRTGLVDLELPVEQMPDRLVQYAQHVAALGDSEVVPELQQDGSRELQQVLSVLRARTGHDFSGYKDNTLVRRIQRRMNLVQIRDAESYLTFLREDGAEAERLFRDLLIGVTCFFRDPEAYEVVRTRAIPAILRSRPPNEPIRVWVAGCSTGEEAYSLAMLFVEAIEASEERSRRIQIFATDIDDAALEVARMGVYPAAALEPLSERRRERFFEAQGESWRAKRHLREHVLFAVHDLIQDPPFSRLDLVSCRNVLIYLDVTLQRRVLPVIHYALRLAGWLLLGPSEGTSGAEKLFEAVDRRNRLFRARERPPASGLPFLPSAELGSRGARPAGEDRALSDAAASRLIERLLIDAFAPPCAVVGAGDRALYFTGSTSAYLEMPRGSASLNIFDLARPELTMELRRLLREVERTGAVATGRELRLRNDDETHAFRIRVRPLEAHGIDGGLRLIVFERSEAKESIEAVRVERPLGIPEGEESLVRHLEHELAITRQTLETTVEELETSNEELKTSNEEFMSMNEELQSTVEELETSKEELQSMNEELVTVNAELRGKIEELDRTNSDLQNLLESTRVATLFLDSDLRIRGFTPPLNGLFRLIDTDRGRSVGDLVRHFERATFEDEVRAVVSSLTPFEAEVTTEAARSFTMRIFPYRTVDNVIDGAVVTFNETTALVRARDEVSGLNRRLQYRLEELELMLELIPAGVILCEDPASDFVRVNQRAAELCGVPTGELLRLHPEDRGPFQILENGEPVPVDELPIPRALDRAEPQAARELTLVRADGSRREVQYAASPLVGETGEVRGVIAALVDVTDERAHADELASRAERQGLIAEIGLAVLAQSDVDQILGHVAQRVSAALRAPMCALYHAASAAEVDVVAEVGLGDAVGGVTLPGTSRSHVTYALATREPVFVRDTREEARFETPAFLADRDVRSVLSVVIGGAEQPWGVLAVYGTEPRIYSEDETAFLQAAANTLAIALERARVDGELAKSQRRLELARAEEQLAQTERLASLGAMAGAIAHEINNPINTVLMNAELASMLLEEDGDREAVLDALQRVTEGARRCGQITHSVLSFARERRGQAVAVDLRELALRIEALPFRRLRIDVEVPENLTIEADPEALSRVLDNLVRNAEEAGATRAWIRGVPGRSDVLLCVDDDGPGVSEELRAKVFDPFFSTRRTEGGTGLGLSLVDRIVRDHDGRVEILTSPEGGARFQLRLPLKASSRSAPVS